MDTTPESKVDPGRSRQVRSSKRSIAAASLKPSQLLALQAFDVVVRLGSFKAAADALNLSASAVSHRIRLLERTIGNRLFKRSHRAVQPTAAGKALASATGRAFAELSRAALSLDSSGGRQRLRIKVFPLFASAWLIPRLANFTAKHPEIDIAIETSSRLVNFDVEPVDAAICVAQAAFEGLDAQHLADLRSTPVASPALIKRLKLRRPNDLRRAPLVHVTTFPKAWPQWLEDAGVTNLVPAGTIAVDTFVAAIQAAEQGAGVALGMNLFIEEHERRGSIRRLFSAESSTGSYWFVHPLASRQNRALRLFKRWLLSELKFP
jgi:DNA-binding transcriptional LysR family regulator